jgi:hypothetical protein
MIKDLNKEEELQASPEKLHQCEESINSSMENEILKTMDDIISNIGEVPEVQLTTESTIGLELKPNAIS